MIFKDHIFSFQKDAEISYPSSIGHFYTTYDRGRLQDHEAVDYEVYEEEHSDGTHTESESVDIVIDGSKDIDVVTNDMILSMKLYVSILLLYLNEALLILLLHLKAFLNDFLYLKAFLNQMQVKKIQMMLFLIIQNQP